VKKENVVSWFSAGLSSALATDIALRKYPDMKILYIDIAEHHKDSMRFVNQCGKLYKKKIEILKSENKIYGNSVQKCIQSIAFINSPRGAGCTDRLKKRVRKQYENEMKKKGTPVNLYVWGLDASERERERARRIETVMPKYHHYFPLIDLNFTKADVHRVFIEEYQKRLGIRRPEMYDLGYNNNNCVGCVKGGAGYWNKIRIDFPEVFYKMAKIERIIGHSCIKDVFLDELDPDAGRKQKPILEDCGIFCEYGY
jgi:3'-phosphoadenosine 5'-phosphosulfate sulfotransferase (PAPS reductase)/FAD synthetase